MWPDWRGECAIVVAAGPSAKDAPLEEVRGRARVIAVNESWRLAPWADVLYGCDGSWWKLRGGVPEFKGMKISQDLTTAIKFPDVRKVKVILKVDKILTDKIGKIGAGNKSGGGNSGFQALNLAVQFGAKKIVLVGFDLRIDRGVHWHGRHEKGLNNPREPNMKPWRQALDAAADTFKDLGVEVLNASPISKLTAYPMVDLEKALSC